MRRRRGGAGEPVRYAPRPPAPDVAATGAGLPNDPSSEPADVPLPQPLAVALRDLYAAPADDAPGWEALEARILAAVRTAAHTAGGAVAGGVTGAVGHAVSGVVTGAMRAVPAAVEWWQALARWTRPAFAAAAAVLVAAGATLARARATADASRTHSAYEAVLGDPYDPSALAALPAPDPQLARAVDAFDAEPGDTAAAAEARAARVAAELLSDGLVRRAPAPPGAPAAAVEAGGAEREGTGPSGQRPFGRDPRARGGSPLGRGFPTP